MELNLSPQDRRLATYLAEFPMIHSTPVYFGNPERDDSKINNGTASLLKRGNRLFSVTNHHVIAKFDERKNSEDGVLLQLGGLNFESLTNRIIYNDEDIDVCVMEFSDFSVADFQLFGNVPTNFYELGNIDELDVEPKAVAFGGYPGVFRERINTNKVNFNTFSSGASVIETITDRNIVVSIDHSEDMITSLSPEAPPHNIAGLSGGPVFAVSSAGKLATFNFVGIISECNENLQVLFAKPVQLFRHAFD